MIQKVINGWNRFGYSSIICDDSIFEGDVKVTTNEDLFAGEVKITDAWRGHVSQFTVSSCLFVDED